jgi:hypothetical protein
MADEPRSVTRIPALKVHQWLTSWEEVQYDDPSEAGNHRAKPKPWFLIFSLPVSQLLPLCGIQPRTTAGGLPRAQDTGIQRKHDPSRSKEIREYVQYGYPWSELSTAKRNSGKFGDLRKPGWLPTSVVLNILTHEQERRGQRVRQEDLLCLEEETEHSATVVLPGSLPDASRLPPIEIIDGQHRLFAFRGWNPDDMNGFDIPVVAFYGLDLSWQAYLFWTINIKPKRINPSLAFDLYPLLRQEDWLERFHGHSIYREARAQEITARLWSSPLSPWHQRIDMLGDQRRRFVSQNAWVKSLYAAFIKPWEGTRIRIGGLFGAKVGEDDTVLPWDLAMQSAFLIFAWRQLKDAIWEYRSGWAEKLREGQRSPDDPAFSGGYTLLNTEQGIRGFLHILNDLCFVAADNLGLSKWQPPEVDEPEASDQGAADKDNLSELMIESEIQACLDAIDQHSVGEYIKNIAKQLATFDWCTSDAPHLDQHEKEVKMAFRGSGGYTLVRRHLLRHLLKSDNEDVVSATREVRHRLGWSEQ